MLSLTRYFTSVRHNSQSHNSIIADNLCRRVEGQHGISMTYVPVALTIYSLMSARCPRDTILNALYNKIVITYYLTREFSLRRCLSHIQHKYIDRRGRLCYPSHKRGAGADWGNNTGSGSTRQRKLQNFGSEEVFGGTMRSKCDSFRRA